MEDDKLLLITIKWGRARQSRLYITRDPDDELRHMSMDLLRKEDSIPNFQPDEDNIAIHFPYSSSKVPIARAYWAYTPRSQRESMLSGTKVNRTGNLKRYQLEPDKVADKVFNVRDSNPLWTIDNIANHLGMDHGKVKSILQNELAYQARKEENLTLVNMLIGKYFRSYVMLTYLNESEIREVLDSSLDELEDSGKFDGTVDTSDALADKLSEYGDILNNNIEKIWDYEVEKAKEIEKWNKAVDYYAGHPFRLAKSRLSDWLWKWFR